jgi:Zn finger protein HypA/HybF involved in hydrogenase expression
MLIENEKQNEFYSKEDKIIKCPHCNYQQFYVKNKSLHKCNITNEDYEIDESFVKKNEKFLCDIKDVENKCIKHREEFIYFKDNNYFCEKCKEERTNLDNIIELKKISEEEKSEFKMTIEKSEDIF